MKNRLVSIVLILVFSASFAIAQEKSKTSFGILGGVNFQNLNGKLSSGDKLKNDMLLGFHGGVNLQIPIAPEFYFQPGLMYAVKGAKNTTTILGSEITDEIKLNYIEMPLNLVYKGALGNGFILLGFGPYVAYGISGKQVIQGKSFSYERGVDYNAFDAGANIFFGYEMASGIFLQLDTQFGMPDIDPNENRTAKNTGFGLSLGYRF
ncbi:MAG: PorT family protein [Prolixibacteraceae bacterium]|nr:PorT family protein [Prolixibacteraceae bacterium]